jgi:hypothetical protein
VISKSLGLKMLKFTFVGLDSVDVQLFIYIVSNINFAQEDKIQRDQDDS